MNIIPAVDIKDGNVVRLTRGDYAKVKIYSKDPVETARKWCAQGASILHVVDLDGALKGEPKNMDTVAKIIKAITVPVELGGGLRDLDAIKSAFDIGVSKVVLGTRALEDVDFVKDVLGKYGGKIIVSIDSKEGIVMLKGWTEKSGINALDIARKMEGLGASAVIYTDVTVDGTLGGPNFKRLDSFLSNLNIPVIVAGGISSIDDIKKLCALNKKNLAGAIVGKALYEGAIHLREAIKICSQKG